MARNYFQGGDAMDVINAGNAGWDDTQARIDGIMSKRANVRAAPRIAAGDYQGAAGEFGAAGMSKEALAMRGAQQGAVDRATATARQGKLDTEHDQDRAHEEVTRKAGELKQLTGALRQVPPGKRVEFLQQALPILQQSTGMDVTQFQALTEDQLTDANLTAFDGEVDKLQIVNRGRGGYDVVRQRDGGLVRSVEPSENINDDVIEDPNNPGQYIPNPAKVAFRRETRAPPRGRSGGGGGGGSVLPPGYRPK